MSILLFEDRPKFSPTMLGKDGSLRLWLDSSDSTTITKTYQNLAATGTGTSGTTVITASGIVTNLVQPGFKLRIGGADIYTVASITGAGLTINTVETLSTNYVASAMALDRVSQWNDKSGQGNHVTQATALAQPVYNPAQLNGKAVLGFDGASFLALPSALLSIPNSANTLFVVAKQATASGVQERIIAMSESGSSRWIFGYQATAGQVVYMSNTGIAAIAASGVTTTNFNILTGRRSGTTQAISVNNGAETSNANGQDENGCSVGAIGNSSVGGLFLIGALSKILIYNRSLSAAEIIQVNRFLSQEGAIAIS